MKTINVSVRIPEDLHKEFKVKMVLDGESMQNHIINLIKEDLDKSKKSK